MLFSAHQRATLEAQIRTDIPITRHLQFSIAACDAEGLTLRAPLSANINHKGTVFGGSLSMLATIAGWAMTQHILLQADLAAQVVIQQQSMAFHHPVRSDIEFVCAAPTETTIARFCDMLRRYRKARLRLTCTVHTQTTLAVQFEGAYVALHPQAR